MRRIEMITGTERRRNRSRDEKAAIVAESMAPGAVIAEVARRHGLSPQQLYGWRSTLKAAANTQITSAFAAAVVDDSRNAPPISTDASHDEVVPSIEMTVGRAHIVIRGATDQTTLASVLKALKGLA